MNKPQSQNVCFGCHSTTDVRTCKDCSCFAYPYRKEGLTLDHELNKEINLMVQRSKREMHMV